MALPSRLADDIGGGGKRVGIFGSSMSVAALRVCLACVQRARLPPSTMFVLHCATPPKTSMNEHPIPHTECRTECRTEAQFVLLLPSARRVIACVLTGCRFGACFRRGGSGLQGIHVYVLAQILRRAVVVYGYDDLDARESGDSLTGVFLPSQWEPDGERVG